MHNDLTGESAIDFPLGGLELGQTAHTIRSMLGQRPDQQGPGEPFPGDDLLVAGYGYFDASTLMHLGLGDWLASEPGRCMMLILGFHGKSPLRVQDAPWQRSALPWPNSWTNGRTKVCRWKTSASTASHGGM